MARRGPSHDSQDSLKENNGVVDAVTAHTKTNERVARGKRAAMRDHIDADDDAERDAEAEEDAQGEDDDQD